MTTPVEPRAQPAPTLRVRDVPPRVAFALEQAGVHPLLARLFAARGVRSPDELDDGLARLLPPDALKGTAEAATLLADAITKSERLCVVADYDCDGATACAVALRGLAMLGARPEQLHYVVPDRKVHGYGLTPAIVDLAMAHRPDVLVTVDNGIAQRAGMAHAQLEVLLAHQALLQHLHLVAEHRRLEALAPDLVVKLAHGGGVEVLGVQGAIGGQRAAQGLGLQPLARHLLQGR